MAEQVPAPQERLYLDADGNVTTDEQQGKVLLAAGGGVPVSVDAAEKVNAYLAAQAPKAAAPQAEATETERAVTKPAKR